MAGAGGTSDSCVGTPPVGWGVRRGFGGAGPAPLYPRASGAALHLPPRLAPRGELRPLSGDPKHSDLLLSARESGFRDQLSEVTKKRLPLGVGSGELPDSRWRQLGAAARCLEARQPFFVVGRPKPAARLSRARQAVSLRRPPIPGLRLAGAHSDTAACSVLTGAYP